MRKKDEDVLAKAIAQLRQEGLSDPVPAGLVDETVRRIADQQSRDRSAIGNPQTGPHTFVRLGFKLAAAAVLIVGSYVAGRVSTPAPDLERLREALTPAVAAALEPVLRRELGADLKNQYQLALAGTCVRLKDELTTQYREDLNRFAIQTLAASNATTNELLAGLIQAIDTAHDLVPRHIARALYQIESSRVQDNTQLAVGLQTLACRTEDEWSRTKKVLVHLLVDEPPGDSYLQPPPRVHTENERSKE
jgi:hypothetical protein